MSTRSQPYSRHTLNIMPHCVYFYVWHHTGPRSNTSGSAPPQLPEVSGVRAGTLRASSAPTSDAVSPSARKGERSHRRNERRRKGVTRNSKTSGQQGPGGCGAEQPRTELAWPLRVPGVRNARPDRRRGTATGTGPAWSAVVGQDRARLSDLLSTQHSERPPAARGVSNGGRTDVSVLPARFSAHLTCSCK